MIRQKREFSTFGIECKKRMLEMNISQKELAKIVGTTDKYLDLVFHGERAGTKYIGKIKEILKFIQNY
ncbi:XRE family transcriptional regulator [Clostridium sp.]|uniref:helix-turn-helix domain-containing protein n=1 Tax=Clostridium sp. TaxID=1506 RepID=UPI00284D0E28|nr:XRE family transcriptional regulator [Clostridium sp.]MDR3597686.1 XRE family transcriptional regulator [Clostridium sp.]